MPCVREKKAAGRKAYIAQNRVLVDRFDGITDPIEVILLIHQPPAYDPLKLYVPFSQSTGSVYRSLSQDDATGLLDAASSDNKLLQEVASHLALFTALDLTLPQDRLLDLGDAHPAHVFRDAVEDVVRRILSIVLSSTSVLRDHALCALAWTRHPAAIEYFRAWRDAPPLWSTDLYLPPHRYTECAGYQVRADSVRDLYFKKCFRLTLHKAHEPTVSPNLVTLCNPISGPTNCSTCKAPCVELLRFDLQDLSESHPRRSTDDCFVPTCLFCTAYRTVYAQFREASWNWVDTDCIDFPSSDAFDIEPHRAELNDMRAPWEAADWCLAEGLSQLGGLPSWISDFAYPECPSCKDLMRFVGQVALRDLLDFREGIVYAFWCVDCRTTATTYDQT